LEALKNILRYEALAACSREHVEWDQRANALELTPLVQAGAPHSVRMVDVRSQSGAFDHLATRTLISYNGFVLSGVINLPLEQASWTAKLKGRLPFQRAQAHRLS
jgi:hypothetical protein